ncbi:hypothetical protein Q0M94_22790 (plasmid) [Deinococcus radiomollis]|uniref:hypothetical protein n=1 Tax=Deinococcus radiomollis TaxID=468916 RepID=UPI003892B2E7
MTTQTLTDWARQMLRVAQRWCPGRQLIVVADSAYAVIKWLFDLQRGCPITVISIGTPLTHEENTVLEGIYVT